MRKRQHLDIAQTVNRLRARVLFSQFKTCEICKNRDKKGKARREQIENHLQHWVAIAGCIIYIIISKKGGVCFFNSN
jgi:hypothetical protein